MAGPTNDRHVPGPLSRFRRELEHLLNPFTHIYEAEKDLQSISAVVAAMCFSHTGKAPEAVAELATSLIRQAVYWAYENEGSHASIDTVYRYLATYPAESRGIVSHYDKEDKKKFTDIAQTLAFTLEAFTSGHAFGKWFSGPATFDIASDEFVVLELENLKPQKALFNVITLQVIDSVTKDLYLSDKSGPDSSSSTRPGSSSGTTAP